jgi:hypothetical protein
VSSSVYRRTEFVLNFPPKATGVGVTLFVNDPDTQLAFALFENKGVYALLLGSGLSRAADIPTGWEITRDLIRRIGVTRGAEGQQDWEKWYREQTGTTPNYSELIEELGLSPDERRSILHSYIEPSAVDREEGRKLPTKAHLAIADLVRDGYIRVIITTNFDRLIENALRERGVEPTIVASADALVGAEPIAHSNCYILKLHGDYKDARILNTDVELSSYPPVYDRLLDRIFDEYGLIIVGWSGEWDHALRAAILRTVNRRYTFYWAARGEIGDAAKGLVDHRLARIVAIVDADHFFVGLQQKIEALQQSQIQNPLSIELLVNSVKRYLEKPEHRIQLDELVTHQTDQLIDLIGSTELGPHGPISEEEFRRRVNIYEDATEPLARIAGVLGRWGTGNELSIVRDIVTSLHAQAEREKSGTVVFLGLRSYPAVLVFTAYGLGLTRSLRWSTLHQLFFAEIHSDHKSARFVDALFMWKWKGFEDSWWKKIKGLDRRHTPLSDHLCTLMDRWGTSFIGLESDFELLFERFEMLGSLAYLEGSSESDLIAELEQQVQPGKKAGFVWMPIGRMGWDGQRRERLLKEIESGDTKASYLKAGFAQKSDKFLGLFAENFERLRGALNWW